MKQSFRLFAGIVKVELLGDTEELIEEERLKDLQSAFKEKGGAA